MTNPVLGEATLTLSDGRELTIVFSATALIHAETLYRKPSGDIMVEAAQGYLGAITALLEGSLKKYHSDIGSEEVADIALRQTMAVRAAVDEAARLAFPDATTEERKGPNPPGKNSGANGAQRASTRKSSGKPPPVTSV
jgi:hypothetical protein